MTEDTEQPGLLPELAEFLAGIGLTESQLDWCDPGGVPEPEHSLLVHDRDMTSALERHHGEAASLEVRRAVTREGRYFREVVLRGRESGTPVEYGAIEIMLDRFPPALSEEIREGRRPLGGILNRHEFPYRSRPMGYFRVPGESVRAVFPDAPGGETSFGRYNQLLGSSSESLAVIIEILPPSKK